MYLIDPSKPGQAPKLVAQFPDSLACLGITEIENNVFAVVRQNFSISTFTYTAGSSVISKIDLRDEDKPKVSTIAPIPQAQLLNGMTTVAPGSKYVLIADSEAGVVWRLNTKNSQVDSVLNVTATRPTVSIAQGGFGVNGVHTQDGQLYFTNLNRGFYRVPIHSDGTQAGQVVKIAGFPDGDDFALDSSGNTYISRGAVDKIEVVSSSGESTALKYRNKNALELIEGNTAVSFGRTKRDKRTLYVTTNGGLSGLVKGTEVQGGRVLALDLE